MCCWIELKVDKVQDYFTCAVYTLTFGIIWLCVCIL
jgi:hypothetical protein